MAVDRLCEVGVSDMAVDRLGEVGVRQIGCR
jgi:hypothetical protein